MRDRWIDDLLRSPIEARTIVNGRADWTPSRNETVRGRARLVLCRSDDRRLLGMTITRRGRTLVRGLFDCSDIVVQSSSPNHVGLVISTNPNHGVSLLHVEGQGCDLVGTFARG